MFTNSNKARPEKREQKTSCLYRFENKPLNSTMAFVSRAALIFSMVIHQGLARTSLRKYDYTKPPFQDKTLHVQEMNDAGLSRDLNEKYPVAVTATLLPKTNVVHEIDLLESKNWHDNEGEQKVTFLVHSTAEFTKLSKSDGLVDMKVDPNFSLDNNLAANNSIILDESKMMRARIRAGSAQRVSPLPESTARTTAPTIRNFPCYRNLASTFQFMNEIANKYPNLATVVDIGDSYLKVKDATQGYDIKVLHITNKNNTDTVGTKAPFFAMFGIHPREYAPPELGMRFAETLVSGYGVDAEITTIVDQTEIHLVLQANPDGRFEAESRPSSMYRRKNMNSEEGGICGEEGSGVDLNRNFPFKWGGLGSSGYPCSQTYRGESPASEPEVQAIVDYLSTVFPAEQQNSDPSGVNFEDVLRTKESGVFFDVHSYSELNLWSWAYQNARNTNDLALQTLGRKFKSFNNYALAGPEQEAFLYEADGVTMDYAYGVLGASSHTLELGTWFHQDCSTFENEIVPSNLPVLLYGAKVARAPYMIPLGPDVMSIASPISSTDVVPSIPQQSSLTVSVEVSDSARSTFTNEVVESIETGNQGILSVRVFVDQYPSMFDEEGGLDLLPKDGVFDSGTETATVKIPMASFAPGRHVLHIQAMDNEGYAGPVTSRFFDVCQSTGDKCSEAPKCEAITDWLWNFFECIDEWW